MSSLPRPLRAAIGLAATAVDNVRSAPQKALELPMSAVSSALQFSLRAQQRYAELLVRGDEALGHLHGVPDLPPAWATFDEDATDVGRGPALSVVADLLDGVEVELDHIEPGDIVEAGDGPVELPLPALETADDVLPALSVVAAAAVVPNPVPTEADEDPETAQSAGPVTEPKAAPKPAAKKAAAKATPKDLAKQTAKKAAPKKVSAPRTGKPSAFDAVDPDAL